MHWPPVKSRKEFKILLLTFKSLNNMAPLYLKELIVPYQPTSTLRSQNSGLLVVPKVSKSRVGARAFSYQAPLLWNHLPLSVREADTICTFKSRLKTFLYEPVQACFGPALSYAAIGLEGQETHDTRSFSFQLLLHYHIKEIHISSIHVTDLTSSPESLCLIVCRSRAVAASTSWNMLVDRVSEIVIVMVDPVSCWHLIMVVDHDWGGSWWWILMAAVDNDCGLWWHLISMVDHDHGGCWPWTMITMRLLDMYISPQILDHNWQ